MHSSQHITPQKKFLPVFILSAIIYALVCPGETATAAPVRQRVSTDTFPQQSITKTDTSSRLYDTPASYQNGSNDWTHYLIETLRYPPNAQKQGLHGNILVHFTVSEKGRVSDLIPTAGPKVLQKEAVRVVKNSGRWNPALLNGNPVSSRRVVSITFTTDTF